MRSRDVNETMSRRIPYFIAGTIMTVLLGSYLVRAVGVMPLMDYYLDGGSYLSKIMEGEVTVADIITIPHTLHWNPFNKLAQIVFVKVFACDNRAYVFAGMLFSILLIAFLIYVYSKHFGSKNRTLDLLGVFVCTFPIINLNQWEIFTLYCNFAFMVRIFLYLLMFFLLDQYVKGKLQPLFTIILSVTNVIIILFFSQAYFPGYIAGTTIIFLLHYWKKKIDFQHKFFIIMFEASSLCSAAYYFLTLKSAGGATSASDGLILTYCKGLLIMLSATIIPESFQSDNMFIRYVVGSVILILAIGAVWFFLKTKVYEKTCFPIACLVYAFVSIIVIIYGRAGAYGISHLKSSRYVVETTIGLVGLAQIYWSWANRNWKECILGGLVLATLFGGLVWAMRTEFEIAPYRKIYNDQMVSLALTIDERTDDELSVFQSDPQNVRDTIDVMKKYNLSIWRVQ